MVACPRIRQDFEVNPEEREIDEERQNNKTKNPCDEVPQDMFLYSLLKLIKPWRYTNGAP